MRIGIYDPEVVEVEAGELLPGTVLFTVDVAFVDDHVGAFEIVVPFAVKVAEDGGPVVVPTAEVRFNEGPIERLHLELLRVWYDFASPHYARLGRPVPGKPADSRDSWMHKRWPTAKAALAEVLVTEAERKMRRRDITNLR